jgi:hypothetical protein
MAVCTQGTVPSWLLKQSPLLCGYQVDKSEAAAEKVAALEAKLAEALAKQEMIGADLRNLHEQQVPLRGKPPNLDESGDDSVEEEEDDNNDEAVEQTLEELGELVRVEQC